MSRIGGQMQGQKTSDSQKSQAEIPLAEVVVHFPAGSHGC